MQIRTGSVMRCVSDFWLKSELNPKNNLMFSRKKWSVLDFSGLLPEKQVAENLPKYEKLRSTPRLQL